MATLKTVFEKLALWVFFGLKIPVYAIFGFIFQNSAFQEAVWVTFGYNRQPVDLY